MADVAHSTLDADHAWTSTTYNTAIKFDKRTRYMPQQAVSGAITFTVDTTNRIVGGECYVRLVANGTNAPGFTGYAEHGSSAGYDNRSGILNTLLVWYDGSTTWYAWGQEVNAVPIDVFAPTLSSAVISNAAKTTLTLTYSEALDTGSTPATGDFTISNSGGTDTVSGVSVTGSTVVLTKSRTTLYSDTVTVSYTPGTNKVRDLAGNLAASLSSQAVTNNVPAPDVTAPTLSSATVENATKTTLTLTYNEALDATSTPATGDFSISNSGGSDTVSGVSVTGSTVVITKSRTSLSTDTITISYTPGTNRIRDVAGNNAASLSSQAVTNNVSSGGSPITFGTMNKITYASDVHTAAATAAYGSCYTGSPSVTIAASTDGGVTGKFDNKTYGTMLGVDDTSTATSYTGWVYAIYQDPGNIYRLIVSGSTAVPNINGSFATAANHYVRVKRTGTTYTAEVSTDNSSWTTIDSRTVAVSGVLYPALSFNSAGGTVSAIRSVP